MLFSRCLLILTLNLSLVLPGTLLAGREPEAFPARLQSAFLALLQEGAPDPGPFEALLADNPDEWSVYHNYVRAWLIRGAYAEALSVLERALTRPPLAQNLGREIQIRIEEIESRRDYARRLPETPPWEDAVTLGNAYFSVKSNVAQEFLIPLVESIQEIYEAELALLTSIFGESDQSPDHMTFYFFARFEELDHYIRTEVDPGIGQLPAGFNGMYNKENKIMAVSFDGTVNMLVVAHEMVHYFLPQLFIRDPSRLLDEGFAEYVSVKVAKDRAPVEIISKIRRMNVEYDQGGWQSLEDLPETWETFERIAGLNRHHPGIIRFYLMAWTFIAYLIESEDETARSFRKSYFEHERTHPRTSAGGFQTFLKEKLSEEQLRELENGWLRHMLAVTYENA